MSTRFRYRKVTNIENEPAAVLNFLSHAQQVHVAQQLV